MGTGDGTLSIADAASGKIIRQLRRHTKAVWDLVRVGNEVCFVYRARVGGARRLLAMLECGVILAGECARAWLLA
jgi:hypothetical protein